VRMEAVSCPAASFALPWFALAFRRGLALPPPGVQGDIVPPIGDQLPVLTPSETPPTKCCMSCALPPTNSPGWRFPRTNREELKSFCELNALPAPELPGLKLEPLVRLPKMPCRPEFMPEGIAP
jgi:hypothetical protein